MGVLSNLEPREVFEYFEQVCSIPRASYQEDKISDYCVEFAKSHGLTYYQDDLKNVIIIKEASPGYENEPAVMLQGHLDMVCEKESGCAIDFASDGLELMVEGDDITANGTTLGGDDGIAIAYCLAILASDTIQHPRLEVVFTASEEVGMDGASGIDVSMLESRQLINLDSEEEGILLAGCAGGASVACKLAVQRMPAVGTALQITVTGLLGGHSGTEIDKGRANANTLMGRLMITLSKTVKYKLAAYDGGSKDNAIPRECRIVICVAPEAVDSVRQVIDKLQQDISAEYAVTDPDIRFVVDTDTGRPLSMLDETSTRRVITFVNSLPNGIRRMSADVEGLVETSLNLGVLKLDGSVLQLRYAVRSSVESAKDALIDKLTYVTEGLDGTVELSGDYPAWEYKRDSALRDKMVAIYERMYGKKPVIEAIHAGLECGLLAGKLPGLDCISMGPDMQSVHTTEEKLSISSTKRVWEYLLEVLKTK